ncbi:MAG: selenide, water dikinase SelD [Bacteroidetes bacterium]|nr:selenide, water dikinase SelD [Bacteroidota bacterium]
MESYKLTAFSHGAGCGCKIAPNILEKILSPPSPQRGETKSMLPEFPLRGIEGALLVGYDTKDDAAVYDTGNGKAIISTTDFFMPIVDDAFDFGRIAAANSISDVYAMGGKPLMAIAILGWPVEKIPAEVAQKVLDGARKICEQANIPLAGGHSIDSPEPIFGLAVTGEVEIKNIKRNSTATEGCKLFLTKPLGVGMITTAHKRGVAEKKDFVQAVEIMTQLNSIGYEFGKLDYVKAMTDVTGFGLLGHLIEMCEGSNLSAEIEYEKIPLLKNSSHYASKMIYPDITFRNWNSYEAKVSLVGISNPNQQAESILTLCDPQTSGGLLVAIDSMYEKEFIAFAEKAGLSIASFGVFTAKQEKTVIINGA